MRQDFWCLLDGWQGGGCRWNSFSRLVHSFLCIAYYYYFHFTGLLLSTVHGWVVGGGCCTGACVVAAGWAHQPRRRRRKAPRKQKTKTKLQNKATNQASSTQTQGASSAGSKPAEQPTNPGPGRPARPPHPRKRKAFLCDSPFPNKKRKQEEKPPPCDVTPPRSLAPHPLRRRSLARSLPHCILIKTTPFAYFRKNKESRFILFFMNGRHSLATPTWISLWIQQRKST